MYVFEREQASERGHIYPFTPQISSGQDWAGVLPETESRCPCGPALLSPRLRISNKEDSGSGLEVDPRMLMWHVGISISALLVNTCP